MYFQTLVALSLAAFVAACSGDSTPADASVSTDAIAHPDAAPPASQDAGVVAPDAEPLLAADSGEHPDAEPRIFTLVDRTIQLDRTSTFTVDLKMVDVNGDRVLDVVWLQYIDSDGNGGGTDVSINDGNARFHSIGVTSSTTTRGDIWRTVEAADMDDDGDADLVVTRPSILLPQVALLRNDGSGGFTEDVLALPPNTAVDIGVCYSRATLADLDRDGDRDIIIPIFAEETVMDDVPNVIFLNNDDGTFTRAPANRLPRVPNNMDFTVTIAAGDFDDDRDVDLFIGEAQAQQRLFVNDGRGTFTDGTRALFPTAVYYPGEAVVFDIDDDGDRDIISTSADGRAAGPSGFVFTNDGTGIFTSTALPTEAFTSGATDLVVGDVNRDNRFDLLWINGQGPPDPMMELAERDERGKWTLSPIRIGIQAELLAIEMGDLDGDNDLDLVASSSIARFVLLQE